MSLQVKPARLGQLMVLHQLFRQAVASDFNYFPPDVLRQTLAQGSFWHLAVAILKPGRLVLTASSGGQLVGFLIGSVPPDKNAQIYWLYVSPAQRGSGTGGSLLSAALAAMKAQGARKVFLETHNKAEYYQKRGFRLLRREAQKYDGIGMSLLVLDTDESK